jgi:hypothetical protein
MASKSSSFQTASNLESNPPLIEQFPDRVPLLWRVDNGLVEHIGTRYGHTARIDKLEKEIEEQFTRGDA